MSIAADPRQFAADTEGMARLGARAWKLFADAEATDRAVVPPASGPVLFFGDLEAFRASKVRVITVGLNPSLAEFPLAAPWQRFPELDRPDRYIDSLSAYFRTDPYRAWFNSYEPMLQGLGASYYPGASSTALHTDLLTPVPTNPTWSKLTQATRQRLGSAGTPMWSELAEELQPHVVLISVARRHLAALDVVAPWRAFHTIERRNPYVVEATELRVASRPLVVWGRAANTPFGTISNPHKSVIGQRVLESV